FRHPTTWHIRTYGLYCANPFGIGHFTGDKSKDGSYTIKKGEALRLQYRIYIHENDTTTAAVADWYGAYAAPPTTTVAAK
ncbi:MAG: DUF6807 family protein, partial [Planctomycetia bacterium]